MKEEKIKISVNQEDVQNIINCYEKDIERIKQLEELIKEARETIKTKLQKSFAYDYGLSKVDAPSKDRLFTETVIELQLIDKILSKGEKE